MPCTEERHTYCLFFWHVSEVLQCPVDVGCVTSRWQYCSFHIVSICLACPTKQTFLSREDKAFFMCLLSHSMCLLGAVYLRAQFVSGFVCLPWANEENVFWFWRPCYLGLTESAVDSAVLVGHFISSSCSQPSLCRGFLPLQSSFVYTFLKSH